MSEIQARLLHFVRNDSPGHSVRNDSPGRNVRNDSSDMSLQPDYCHRERLFVIVSVAK